MQHKTITNFIKQFEEDVYKGLTDFPKHLSSKYFYDERGDRLFQQIMHMPEYYLTDCEFDILTHHKEQIIQWFEKGSADINLIELGAGDGKKTKILLEHMVNRNLQFKYTPIDISQNALHKLERSIEQELPDVEVATRQGTYFEVLQHLSTLNGSKKVILFLGSNIGNLLHADAVEFLGKLQKVMTEDDLLLIGFDQKKNPQTVLNAYNDPAGITEDFNKNILLRINKELSGNFVLENFLHWEVYDPETGTAKSYLVSKKEQTVSIDALGLKVVFKPWETIHTEISQKYDDEIVNWLAGKAGLSVEAVFSTQNQAYKNYIFKKRKNESNLE
ncbi:MAG: L-histidine N(alpha)-methyltransferase [Flavobacteriaceae bacterium]